MYLLIGSSINLIPDKTVIFQIIIFLVSSFFLTVFIFNPIIKILNLRYKKTIGMQNKAEELLAESINLTTKYSEKIKKAKDDGLEIQLKLIQDAKKKAQQIILKTKDEEHDKRLQIEKHLADQKDKIEKRFTTSINEYVADIEHKILRRS